MTCPHPAPPPHHLLAPSLSRRQALRAAAVGSTGLGALLLGLGASPAHAFRPSTRWHLGRLAERALERGSKTLKVEAELTRYDGRGRVLGALVQERLTFERPGNVRREWEDDQGLTVEVRADGRWLLREPGKPERQGKAPVDLLADAIVPNDADSCATRLLAGMKALGVNPELVSFSRFDGRVCALIGSKPWEQDKPQVWLDKDTLLLVRVVTFGKGPDGKPLRSDLRFRGWGSPVGGNWYPSEVELWEGEGLVRRSVTRGVERNMALDTSTFALR
jgi:hypothetical protein